MPQDDQSMTTIASTLPDGGKLSAVTDTASPQGGSPAAVELDWVGYFRAFSDAHGGSPLLHQGRLLFPDGWRYSSSDHAGPEWPPPEDRDARRGLLLAYWTRRKGIVHAEHLRLKDDLEHLRGMQALRRVPLHVVRRERTEDGWKTVSEPMDLAPLEGRLAWLADDLVECDKVLAALRSAGNELQRPEGEVQ